MIYKRTFTLLKRPIKKDEDIFDSLDDKWFEEAQIDGLRLLLTKSEILQIDGKNYSGEHIENIKAVHAELSCIFDYDLYDVITITEGKHKGLTFLLDLPDCSLPFSARHTLTRASLPNLHSVIEYNYDSKLSALPCMLPGGKQGELYLELKKVTPFTKKFLSVELYLKIPAGLYDTEPIKSAHGIFPNEWYSVKF